MNRTQKTPHQNDEGMSDRELLLDIHRQNGVTEKKLDELKLHAAKQGAIAGAVAGGISGGLVSGAIALIRAKMGF